VQQHVVTARDQLALEAARDLRTGCEARPDREVSASFEQWEHKLTQRRQVGRQIDIHVGEDIRIASHPCDAQRVAAALAIEVQDLDVLELVSEHPRDVERHVAARLIGDRDLSRDGEALREVRVQPAHARLEDPVIVVDWYHDLQGAHALILARLRAEPVRLA